MPSLRTDTDSIETGAFFTSTTLAGKNTTATNSTVPYVSYSASDGSIQFAVNIDTNTNDLYFSLSTLGDGSWTGVGIGSDQMDDKALILIAYPTSNQQNVTVSPRRTTGHTEPSYTNNYTLELLPGSCIEDENLYAYGRLNGCGDLWTGNTSFIFAYGPGPVSNGDSVTADLRFHSTVGVFTMDLQQARGNGGVPSLNGRDIGSWEISLETKNELSAPFHGQLLLNPEQNPLY